ncbi:DUF6033 family protein [Selenomonas sp. KH1T6]|uniref:DUF6033 family protein n=1 Tax=Selenomonas sp. KH1T6 TaxID=3158784 RepID=UPI0008A78F15|nr:hypothetical protein SAMN05216583_10713 [Selenomonas ruminantium]
MPVKVGASYVSEAAYEFAKARRAEKEEDKEEKGGLKELKEKYPGLNITVGTGPFSGTGTNNLSISPKILKQMEQDPEKRMEYEALIYDVAHTDVNSGIMPGRKMKSHGFIIDDNGGLRGWGISESNDGSQRHQSHLKRSEKKNWWEEMLGKPKQKKKSLAKVRQELLEKSKEQVAKADEEPKGLLAALQRQGSDVRDKVVQSAKADNSSGFANKDELYKYLQGNYDIVKGGMASISGKFLQKCLTDEESRNRLFDILKAAGESYAKRKDEVGFQGMQITIDENGEVTLESTKSTVSINEDKRRRQIAAAATKEDMQSVIALLEEDLQQVEDGLKQNMCDEAEVAKAKKLLELAKERMAKLPDRAPTPAEQSNMTVNMLI